MTQTAYLQHLNDVLATRRKRNKKIKTAIVAVLVTASVATLPISVAIRDHVRLTEWEETREVRLVRVMPGDSVDGYWAENAPSWMDRSDYREAFKELNNLDSCYLYEGDFVKIYTTP